MFAALGDDPVIPGSNEGGHPNLKGALSASYLVPRPIHGAA